MKVSKIREIFGNLGKYVPDDEIAIAWIDKQWVEEYMCNFGGGEDRLTDKEITEVMTRLEDYESLSNSEIIDPIIDAVIAKREKIGKAKRLQEKD